MQAVILAAGSGSRLTELTNDKPKCLLPVGNNCLIWYAITSLKEAGISKIICLIPDVHENEIKQYCHKKFSSFKNLELTYQIVPMQDNCGTAESLLTVKDKIRGDFLVFSCDSIVDPSAIVNLINQYRLYDPSLSVLLADDEQQPLQIQVPGGKEKEGTVRDIIALDSLDRCCSADESLPQINKIVLFSSARDLDDVIKVKQGIFSLHPNLRVYSRFLDAHIYIFKRSLLEMIEQHKSKTTLKGEILPLLIAKQFTWSKVETEQEDDEINRPSNLYIIDYENELNEKLNQISPENQGVCSAKDLISCHAMILKNTLCLRANSIGAYVECNRRAKTILAKFKPKLIAPKAVPQKVPQELESKNQLSEETPIVETKLKSKPSADSTIGDGLVTGEKCTIKKSCIGHNCKIGDKVKIIDSIIMDNVEIDSNVNITGSIVGTGVKISTKCDLKACIVGARQLVSASCKFSNEVVMDDKYMIDLSDPIDEDDIYAK